MAFYIDDKPSLSEIAGAINYLLANFAQVKAVNPNSGQITTSSFGITGYLYKYLNVKYADSFDGSVNFSDSPTNRLYYGLRNNDSSVESTLYSDYVWTPVTGGFGTTKFFYYATSGGRQIQTTVATTAPANGWAVDTGAAIDLDLVTFVFQGVNTFSAGTTGFTPSTPTKGDVVLAGTLNVTNGGTGVTTSTGTGSVVLSTNPSLTTPTQVTYENWTPISSPTYAEGKVWYDSTQKSLAYFNDVTNNVLHVGQETQLKVYNNTGSTIARGAPVYITSTSSGFSYPLVALAKADTQITGNAIGLANQSIPNATAGYITISGLVNGLSLGAMTVGDTVYVSPYSAGQLMNTYPPTGYPIKIGVVAYANTPNGAIYVNQSNAYVLASGVVGTLAIANGGTNGSAAPTAYGVAYGTGTAYAFTAAGTTGQVLTATTGGNPTWANPATNGTVTSVSFTGGIIAVATATTTPALTVAGTSGGIPYFSSGTTWATSAALAANSLVIGGGAGVAPSTVTTGTGVVTALGVNTGSAGAFVVNGGDLGTPSAGIVTNLTGTASININGTVGATTPNTGAFTSLSYSTTLTGGTGIIAIGTSQIYKDASGNVGLGTATPGATLDVVAGLIRRYSPTAAGNATEGLRLEMAGNVGVARGYYISFYGPNASGTSREVARINGLTNVATNGGGYLSFETASGASGTNLEQFRISSTGNATVVGAGGLGYGTGSGGTATQVTSRTTGVTLNKTNGAITLVSAAGLATFQSFTVTNSTVAATDTVSVVQKSGTDLYQIFVTAVAAGSFRITFATTGGITTEQPVFNFTVTKGVTA